MGLRDILKKTLGKTGDGDRENSSNQGNSNRREVNSMKEEAKTTELRSTAVKGKAPLPSDTDQSTTSRGAAIAVVRDANTGNRGATASRGATSITGGSNTNVDRIKFAQDADVTNNENWGLKVLFEPKNKDHIIDIVAVHGIGADPKDTWTKVEKDGRKIDWLQDKAMLPKLAPNARVMRFGYNAKWFGSSDIQHTKTFVRDVSSQLLTLLGGLREDSARPLIFIAHSFGGLPVIHALRSSYDKPDAWGNPFQLTAGLVFFGVPFRGREGYPIEVWIDKIAEAHIEDPTFQMWPETMGTSIPGSQYLQETVNKYQETRDCEHPIPVCCFYETEPSPVGRLWDGKNPMKYVLIPESSACLDTSKGVSRHSLPRHHYNLQKFTGPNDPAWKVVAPMIAGLAQGASAFLETRAKDHEFSVTLSLAHLTETTNFVARQQDLQKMHQMLHSRRAGRQYVVLSAMGGMGKTQLAIRYAQLHREEYSAVFFLDITDKVSVENSYELIAARISAEHPSASRLRALSKSPDRRLAKAVSAVKEWLENPKNTRWLMVFDNYDNPGIPGNTSPAAVDIQNYLPQVDHGSVIVTTRVAQVELGSQRPMKVDKLNIDSALELLAKVSERRGILTNDHARALATKLDGLPLALAIAGSYLRTSATSFQSYLSLYEKWWKKLQQKSPGVNSYHRTLLTTWQITVDQLAKVHPPSIELLKVFGYMVRAHLSYGLLKEGIIAMPERMRQLVQDELDFNETMRHLHNYSLVELDQSRAELRQDSPLAYTMHPVVHSWCMYDLNENTDVELAWSAFVTAIFMRFPHSHPRHDNSMLSVTDAQAMSLRTLMAKSNRAREELVRVWQTNENIRELLEMQLAIEMPTRWETMDSILDHLGVFGFFRAWGVDFDNFTDLHSWQVDRRDSPRHGRNYQSNLTPEELQARIATGNFPNREDIVKFREG